MKAYALAATLSLVAPSAPTGAQVVISPDIVFPPGGGGGDLSAPTLLDAATNTSTGADSITTASVSPTGDSLLVVAWMNNGPDSDDVLASSVSDTFTGTGTWTIATQIRHYASESVVCGIAYAQAGGSPGSGTVTVNFTNGGARKVVHLMEVTGHNTSSPVAQSATNSNDTSSTLTVTLGATPDAASLVIASLGTDEYTGGTEGAGFTSLSNDAAGSDIALHTQYDLAGADTTADWSGLTSSSSNENAGVAIEISD